MESPLEPPALVAPTSKLGLAVAALRKAVRANVVKAREHNAAFLFTGASLLVSFASIVAGPFMLRIDPVDRGLWDLARTALPFAMLALMGINNGLSRDLPYYFGKADIKTANRLAGTTQFYIALACLLVLVGGLGSLFYFHAAGSKTMFTIASVTHTHGASPCPSNSSKAHSGSPCP